MRAGPIAITGAGGHVGTALQRRLSALPNEVRALGRDADLAAAFRDAAAVVHLAGTLAPHSGDTYESANLHTATAAAGALAGSSVERIVDVSYVGADAFSPNEYLRSKALAEQALEDTGLPLTVLRCTYIFGPPSDPGPSFAPFLAHGGGQVTLIGSGRQRIAPVYVGDVAEAIVRAALDPDAPTGTFSLRGPQELSLHEMVELLNGAAVRERHVPAWVARLLAHLTPKLNPTLVEILLSDSIPRDAPADKLLGIAMRSPAEIYEPAETT
jgi:NADH dehydrogenase